MPISAPIPRSHRKRTGLKPGPVRSPQHRAWIRTQRCCVCGTKGTESNPIQCAHVRRGASAGIGIKPGDYLTLPLCYTHHAEQHALGELAFWRARTENPALLAFIYARRSPDIKVREAVT